jgi:DNA-binding NarL/FixJ family response regulator
LKRYLAVGKSLGDQRASELYLSERTIENDVSKMLRKLDLA